MQKYEDFLDWRKETYQHHLLSRVVRQVSGRTVADYINQMLLKEATWLLQTTSLTVAQIADRLHFADTTTFARFFKRLKGCTPKEYRQRQQ